MQKKPKIVLLDNNDSFTYNWVELLRQLVGEEPLIITPEYKGDLPVADAYIFSPGPGLPSERPLMHRVLREYGQSIPILGICLGHQSIAEYFGGRIYNLGRLNHGLQVPVSYEAGNPLFEGLPKTMEVALYHSWAVDRESLKKGPLKETASWDGVVMALEHTLYNITGFQFHPESFLSTSGKKLIQNWLHSNVYPGMTE